MRRFLQTLTILVFLCGCSTPNPASPTHTATGNNPTSPYITETRTDSTPSLPTATLTPGSVPPIITLPPQGLYDSCVPSSEECLNHLNILAEKGFKLILNYGQLYGDAKSQITYADRAQSLGMQVIWSILPRIGQPDNWMISKYSDLSMGSGCSNNDCLVNYFVNIVKDHPATWGYYVADEIKPVNFLQLKEWSDRIKRADPNHPRLLVTAGSNDPQEHYYWFHSYMSDTADVIGPCYYPYGYIDDGKSLTRFTGETARHAQLWADKLDLQSVMVLQAASLSRYSEVPLCPLWPLCAPFPSYEQMKEQRDQTILNSRPALILWWTYQDILKTDNPEKHLDDLAAAAFSPLPEMSPSPVTVQSECVQNWNCEDIGNPAMKGDQSKINDTWTIRGAGWDIWLKPYVRSDQFHYVWQNMESDGYFSAQVNAQGSPGLESKTGIMVRKTFDPVSPYYAILITSDNRIKVHFRPGFGEETQELASIPIRRSVYLKIVREGTIYRAYTSKNGNIWSLIHDSTVNINSLSGSLMAGMAVTSGDQNLLETASFENVVISLSTP